jgi:8-oxo-dGTP pyrophosphatase MutT (NUDIX family)
MSNVFEPVKYPHGKNVKSENVIPDTVGAVVVTNSNKQILVSFSIKRQVWDVSQGVGENNEDPIETALREMYEEINLKVDKERLIKIGNICSPREAYGSKAFITTLFHLEVTEQEEKNILNKEPSKLLNLQFMNPQQLPMPRGLSLRIALILLNYA